MSKQIFLKQSFFLHILYFILMLLTAGVLFSANGTKSFTISVENTTDSRRENEVIRINLASLKNNHPDFDFSSFVINGSENELPFEIVDDAVTGEKILYVIVDFLPNESKEISFKAVSGSGISLSNKTKAYLGEKINYEKVDGVYTGGEFASVKSARVPSDHFAHDALYQFEGPGWESEKIGYRLYLDDRNRTDIFGKKEYGLQLDIIGKNDLVSDGNESYQSLQEWGRDIFKVGNSLGIGSIAAYYKDKVTTISEADSIYCEISDNNLVSSVKTIHYGWTLDKKYNVSTCYSIVAESRMTEVNVLPDKKIENLSTGLAKHENTEFIVSDGDEEWCYIALWGIQTLENDNLGIAVFYKKSDLVEISEDDLNHFVILKPENKKLTYFFSAAWEQEPNGIKTKDQFIYYLNDELDKINNPVKIVLN